MWGLIRQNAASVKFFAPDVAYADARKYPPELLEMRGLNCVSAMLVLDSFESIVQSLARHDLDTTNKANAILRKGGDRAYDKALRALLPDTREWWQNYVDDEDYTADATGLTTMRWYR